ncbi:uncharacterized protein F5Z01DRAFT_732429 [Emericellopsis atlantica]|uniref:Uncharacterized protein n=1 Tax=Emericellopsis atlantica TaxID=2614577 RepID=A0A9P8CJD8_9HYPO|nr:uncharacterized protein F5Z01DRAFT_732429 [Emericellopsis atlantica]KAG9249374.1 hypothetical protein F5Z01DRAFT_732429 [Emericellopsis atlantica]
MSSFLPGRLPSLAEFDAGVQLLTKRKKSLRRGRSLAHGKRYTVEQSDFIIYARHEMKWSWNKVRDAFAMTFRQERTVPCLQGCYYRTNMHIPMWDAEGFLLFGERDATKPLQFNLKGAQAPPDEDVGLARRHPERAALYSWVHPSVQSQARAWAMKRQEQLRERGQRRKDALKSSGAAKPKYPDTLPL